MDNLRLKSAITSSLERCKDCEFLKRCPNCICEINRRFRFHANLNCEEAPSLIYDKTVLSTVPILISESKPTNYWLQDTPCVKCSRRYYKATVFDNFRFAICISCYLSK